MIAQCPAGRRRRRDRHRRAIPALAAVLLLSAAAGAQTVHNALALAPASHATGPVAAGYLHGRVAAAMNATGDAVVAHRVRISPPGVSPKIYEIRAARFSLTTFLEDLVVATFSDASSDPSVEIGEIAVDMDETGSFVVVFTGHPPGDDTGPLDVLARRYDRAADPMDPHPTLGLRSLLQLTSVPGSSLVDSQIEPDVAFGIDALGNPGFVTIWMTSADPTVAAVARLRHVVDPTGVFDIPSPLLPVTQAAGPSSTRVHPRIGMDGTGRHAVIWIANEFIDPFLGWRDRVYLARYRADDTPEFQTVLVSGADPATAGPLGPPGPHHAPALTVAPNGALAAGWLRRTAVGSTTALAAEVIRLGPASDLLGMNQWALGTVSGQTLAIDHLALAAGSHGYLVAAASRLLPGSPRTTQDVAVIRATQALGGAVVDGPMSEAGGAWPDHAAVAMSDTGIFLVAHARPATALLPSDTLVRFGSVNLLDTIPAGQPGGPGLRAALPGAGGLGYAIVPFVTLNPRGTPLADGRHLPFEMTDPLASVYMALATAAPATLAGNPVLPGILGAPFAPGGSSIDGSGNVALPLLLPLGIPLGFSLLAVDPSALGTDRFLVFHSEGEILTLP